ncbi:MULTISPECIES: SUKH-4 family immunity protein [unclassified Micromonospora]|uniref:SUKH-4 family immunity protein n=1 Tax=unclassified Micromonospora TaxID=2617518 RepID=UPI002FEE763D
MPVDDLPSPPAFEAVMAWAGTGRVVRATELDVATWRLPEPQKAALVSCGVPLIDDLVSAVSFHVEPTMYRLANSDDLDWVYGAAPGTGEVQAWSSDGSTWFVNSTITHWLCSLHMVGSWLTSSTVIGRWDEETDRPKRKRSRSSPTCWSGSGPLTRARSGTATMQPTSGPQCSTGGSTDRCRHPLLPLSARHATSQLVGRDSALGLADERMPQRPMGCDDRER